MAQMKPMEIFTDNNLPVLPNIKNYLSKGFFFIGVGEWWCLGCLSCVYRHLIEIYEIGMSKYWTGWFGLIWKIKFFSLKFGCSIGDSIKVLGIHWIFVSYCQWQDSA